MYVIYAEKPDMGTKIAAALDGIKLKSGKTVAFNELEQYSEEIGKQRTHDGYFYIRFQGEGCYVTWGIGHMCELKQAYDYDPSYKQWTNLPLPYIPESYELKPCEDMTEGSLKKKQFNTIKRLFDKADTLICATDDDREGDLIFWYIYEYLQCKKPFKRCLFNQQTKEEFRKSFNNLVSGVSRRSVIDAGRARSAADFIVGAGPTVAMTLKYSSKDVLSVGRVQTAVLNMLVQRELEIKNFKPEKFWTVSATFTTPSGEKYEGIHASKRFKKVEDADKVINAIKGKKGVVTEIKKKDVTKKRPLLYNLVSLQITANKRFGFTAEKTLKIAQELYEKGFTTYPRTDSAFLSEDMTDQMDKVLASIQKQKEYANLFPAVFEDFKTKEYFDNEKISSHSALVPTTELPSGLTADQAKIYDLVVRSVICMTHPNAVVSESTITTEVNGEKFITKGAMVKKPGFFVVTGTPKEVELPKLYESEEVDGEYKQTIGHTEPPKRFTEGTLLKAMENCGKSIKDAELREIMTHGPDGKPRSLGRPSSQASIIATLKKRAYITASGKTLSPTEKGILMICVLPVEELKSAEMTAMWEKKLDDIEHGNLTYDEFMTEMENRVRVWTKQILEKEVNYKMANAVIREELICPLCKKPMRETENSFQCRDKQACGFFIPKKFAGKKLPEKAIKDLTVKGRTALIHGFVSKKDESKYDAFLVVNRSEKKIMLKLPERTVPDDPAFRCIKCGKPLKVVKWGYACSTYPECKFSIGEVFGVRLDDDQIKNLLTGNKVYVRGIQPKDPSKSQYSANMILDKSTGYVTFYKEDSSPKSNTDDTEDEDYDEDYDYEYEDDEEGDE